MSTKLISIRIGTELLDYLQKRAVNEHRTLSNMIIAILSEEAEPVRHGKWKEHMWAEENEGYLISNYECSYCNGWVRSKSDYCPNCGAKMVETE